MRNQLAVLPALFAVLVSTAASAAITKIIDRKFPEGLCPIESRAAAGVDLSFIAPAASARVSFSVNNYSGGSHNFVHLDNVAVVPKSVFETHQVVTPGFGGCYDPTLIPPGQSSGGILNAPAYDFNASGTAEALLDLFDSDASGWTGSYVYFDPDVQAPTEPATGNGFDGGSLGLGRDVDGAVTVRASKMVNGLTPGAEYVVLAWWSTFSTPSLTIEIDVPCPDGDADGYADCSSTCDLQAGQACGDCDDTDPATNPDASDANCNGIDNDCDGSVDEGVALACECTQPATGLVGWWPGDGSAHDVRGGNSGALQNGAAFAGGEADQAFSLDGFDDYVGPIGTGASYSFIQNTGVFTIAAWINLTDPDALLQQAITANTATSAEKGHYLIWENSTGQKRVRIGLMNGVTGVPVIDSSTPDNAITTTGWHHVAAVGDGAHVTFYVDGVGSLGTGTMGTLGSGDSTRLLDLGRCPYPTPQCHLDGRIDEVQIYDRALVAAEIQAIYDAGSAPMCRCRDIDSDGYGAYGTELCGQGTLRDCDDTDPAAHPDPGGCPDCPVDDPVCDGIDDDCDGQVDEEFPLACLCTEPAPGLLSQWPGEGNANDVRGGLDGTLQNGVTFAVGRSGQSFSLDGIDDHVRVAHDPALDPGTGSFTVTAWVNTSVRGANQLVLSKYECGGFCPSGVATPLYELFVSGTGQPAFHLRDADSQSIQELAAPGSIADGNWHHLAAGRDVAAGTMDVYVDGLAVASAPLSSLANGDIADSDGEPDPLIIGAVYIGGTTTPSGVFSGRIDEVMYYDRALGAVEIQALYDAGSVALCRCTDDDLDGYGAEGGLSCPAGIQQDCNDSDPAFRPGATELCNGLDDDCDGQIDNGLATTTFYRDADGDGYGDTVSSIQACAAPPGYLANGGDCDDADPAVHPGVFDGTCNGIDDDCDGQVDAGFPGGCQCAQRGTGIVGWWPGDWNATDAIGPNDGTLIPGTWVGPGLVGDAFYFNFAPGAGLELPDAPELEFGSQMTIEAWIRVDDLTDIRPIVSKADGFEDAYSFEVYSGGFLNATVSGDGTSSDYLTTDSSVISAGVWTHLATTFDAGLWKIYVNGEVVASKMSSVTSIYGAGSTRPNVGREPTGTFEFIGYIDEPAMYARALTAAEIRAIYETGALGMCPCADADRDGYGSDGLLCPSGTQLDCDDAAPGLWQEPAAVTNVRAANHTTFVWDDQAALVGPDVRYDVTRGPVDYCAASAGVGASVIDPDIPDPGALFWYLVRARNGCGLGDYGGGFAGACP